MRLKIGKLVLGEVVWQKADEVNRDPYGKKAEYDEKLKRVADLDTIVKEYAALFFDLETHHMSEYESLVMEVIEKAAEGELNAMKAVTVPREWLYDLINYANCLHYKDMIEMLEKKGIVVEKK